MFLLLLAMPMRVVRGRSRPMRAGFPTRAHKLRSFDGAHSLLLWRVCTLRERWITSAKTLLHPLKCSFAFKLMYLNTWHLNYNNNFITWITWYCMLHVVFVLSRFTENPPIWSWEMNAYFFRGDSVTDGYHSKIGVKHTLKHLKIRTTLSVSNC
jgi:hypothetical protein